MKPSELFEGENSSLKRTYDEAVAQDGRYSIDGATAYLEWNTQDIQELKDVLDEKVLLGFCYEIERANFTQERYEEFLQTLSDFISQKLKEQSERHKREIKQALDSSHNILPHTFEGYQNKYIHLQDHLLSILSKYE